MNTFKTLGQSLLFAPSLLVDYLSCSRRLIFPPPPSPPPPHPWFPLLSLALIPPATHFLSQHPRFISVSLQSLYLTVVSGQCAQFGLFVSHNCIQSLSYKFQMDISHGICLLYNTGLFWEFCNVLQYKCKLDLSKVEFYKMSTQMNQKTFQILISQLSFTIPGLSVME